MNSNYSVQLVDGEYKMNFNCTVYLIDRNSGYATKPTRSVLSFEKKVDSYKIEAYLLWKPEKKDQVKYLIRRKDLYEIRRNVECIIPLIPDVMFCNNNFRIYFENPFHTLVVFNTDHHSLEQFFHLVKLMADGHWYSVYKKLSSIEIDFTSEITEIVEKKRKYSSRESFPRTNKRLNFCKRNITKIHPRVLLCTPTFHTLRELILTNNQISFLPKELGTLPHLYKLLLSYNCLGNTCLEIAKWEWMEQTAISQSLKELYIDNNNLTELPLQIGKLQSLISLDVSCNLLRKLPQIIGTLQHLARLNVVYNPLLYLPGSMRGMELEMLCAKFDYRFDDYTSPTPKVVSLMDLAAKAVKKYRISYNTLPSKLVRYLDNSKFCCICRMSCFQSDIKGFKPLLDNPRSGSVKRLLVVRNNYFLPIIGRIPFKCYFCSSKCYDYYCETY